MKLPTANGKGVWMNIAFFGELGLFLLLFAWSYNLVSMRTMYLQRSAVYLNIALRYRIIAICLLLAFACLLSAFYYHDYGLQYLFFNASRDTSVAFGLLLPGLVIQDHGYCG